MAMAPVHPAYSRRYPLSRSSTLVTFDVPRRRGARGHRRILSRASSRPVPSLRLALCGLVIGGALLQQAVTSLPVETGPNPMFAQSLPAMAAHVPAKPVGRVTAKKSLSRATIGTPRIQPALRAVPLPIMPVRFSAVDSARVAMRPNPLGEIRHVPSVSVAVIRTALAQAGSPALVAHYADHKDAAQYIWDEGRVLGIDPAVIMAIFHHESVFGTRGMARLTRSVGNIRPLAGQPQLNGYRLYASWEQGVDDCYRLLNQYAHYGATTIPRAIPVWAPPTDNNDDSAYIGSVLATMNDLYAASTGRWP